MPRTTLCLDDYDCIGFDLDHTLCRYNVGPLIRLEYDLLADFLVTKKGYDAAIRDRSFDDDRNFVCKGLTLDCEKGNLLRLAHDGFILSATHGSKRLNDSEIEKTYGRCRKKHPGHEYTQHLAEFGPQKMVDFGPILHSFMDYFDIAAPLLCARIVDVIDQINNFGKPMEEYFFWPDVQEGLRDMFMRTNFASGSGGFFPELQAHPEKYVLKRKPEFKEWLAMLKRNGKYLYVITGSHYDFASHVARHALGEDWMELFDIVIFFARKPSFFLEKRPFWKLEGHKEVESFEGWEDLETGSYYSQGNWKDLNEFFEYCTEWEPSTSLYFGDNVLQDILAPKKFTTTIDSVAVSEDMLAEGMLNIPPSHPHGLDITSASWGSFFFYPDPRIVKKGSIMARASSFKNMSSVKQNGRHSRTNSSIKDDEVRRALSLRRAARSGGDYFYTVKSTSSSPAPTRTPKIGSITPKVSLDISNSSRSATPLDDELESDKKELTDEQSETERATTELVKGSRRINTLWGTFIRDFAKMCIPDLEALVDYPIDYHFPAFGKNKKGETISSGFFPADPASLHTSIPLYK